jgi:LuxR family maltose regulon positive regulatory protein
MATLQIHTPILATKLYRPPVTDHFVARTDLESRLKTGLGLPLTVVSAPAGYGKSTLISHWLDICDCKSAWLSLDESDSDLRVFLRYVLAAIRSAAPDSCSETLALLGGDSLPPVQNVAIYLSNDLHAFKERLVLVLDDYHRITEPSIHLLLDCLLQHPPRSLHLVIVSRHDPPLSLASLRARNFLNEIRMRDLEFSSEETGAFFRQAVGKEIDPEIIQQLQKNVEGWPVGVHLAALALQTHGDAEGMLRRFGADSRPLQQYLIAEVLSDLPDVVRECLLLTSILRRFNAPLCEAVWGNDVAVKDGFGREFIQNLEKSGLFCVRLDGQRNWYRYHHLFSDLLKLQLEESRGTSRKPSSMRWPEAMKLGPRALWGRLGMNS